MSRLSHVSRAISAAVVACVAVGVTPASATVQAAPAAQNSSYWLGEYFNNTELSGQPALLRITRNIVFNWGRSSPGRAVRRDGFSVRWTRPIRMAPGIYQIRTRADDGVRVYVDNRLIVNEWRDGPVRDASANIELGGDHLFRVEYYERTDLASVRVTIARAEGGGGPAPSWTGEYFNNTTLTGQPVLTRNDADVNFDFGAGSPAPIVAVDGFGVRWTRTLVFPAGYYNVNARVDDGVRVYLAGRLVIDDWRDGGARDLTAANLFLSGEVPVRVEYYDRGGSALIRVGFTPASTTGPAPTATPIPVFSEWRGEYFNNATLSGSPALSRNDRDVNFDFGAGAPDSRLPVDNFSARWVRVINFTPGTYRFRVRVDDGARVYVAGRLVINAFVEGAPRVITGDATVSGPSEVRVEYFDRGGGALIQFSYEAVNASFPDWKAEYFSNPTLAGTPVMVRNDREINFDWALGTPDPAVPADNFSVRWTRRQGFNAGTYRLEASVDDGIRVYVDNTLVIDQWFERAIGNVSTSVNLSAGEHDIRVEYFERGGGAIAKFNIVPVNVVLPATPAP